MSKARVARTFKGVRKLPSPPSSRTTTVKASDVFLCVLELPYACVSLSEKASLVDCSQHFLSAADRSHREVVGIKAWIVFIRASAHFWDAEIVQDERQDDRRTMLKRLTSGKVNLFGSAGVGYLSKLPGEIQPNRLAGRDTGQ